MLGLFFVICIIEIIIQLNLIEKLKETSDSKYWDKFLGINFASFFSAILAYFVFLTSVRGFSSSIVSLFICGFSFASSLILHGIGIKTTKFLKKIKLNRSSLSIGSLVLLSNIVVLIIIPVLTNIFIGMKAITYLNNKYGENDFKVTSVEKEYTDSGIIDSYHTGYLISVNSTSLNISFEVRTGTDHKDFRDYFINDYYKDYSYSDEYKRISDNLVEKINIEVENLKNYLSQYNKISFWEINDFDIKKAFGVIPDNYGRIPTVEELFKLAEDYVLKNYLRIIIDEYDTNFKVYSMEEARELLESINESSNIKYTLSGLSVYRNNKIFKSYSSEEDLMNNLTEDLVKYDRLKITSILGEKNILMYNYIEIANHIIEYYPNIDSYKIDLRYSGGNGVGAEITIDSDKIYIRTFKERDHTGTIEKIINR